jgi:hypothetical protein
MGNVQGVIRVLHVEVLVDDILDIPRVEPDHRHLLLRNALLAHWSQQQSIDYPHHDIVMVLPVKNLKGALFGLMNNPGANRLNLQSQLLGSTMNKSLYGIGPQLTLTHEFFHGVAIEGKKVVLTDMANPAGIVFLPRIPPAEPALILRNYYTGHNYTEECRVLG